MLLLHEYVHKLFGELVTDCDPHDCPTVMQRLAGLGKQQKHHKKEHIKAVGRLDMNTEGLLVVTNCGRYAREMELVSSARSNSIICFRRYPWHDPHSNIFWSFDAALIIMSTASLLCCSTI